MPARALLKFRLLFGIHADVKHHRYEISNVPTSLTSSLLTNSIVVPGKHRPHLNAFLRV